MSAIGIATRTVALARVIYVCAAVALVSATAGFTAGWQVHGWRVAKQELKSERTQQRAAAQQRTRQHGIAAENAQAEQAIHEDSRRHRDAIDDEVAAHPERWGCDIGDTGLQAWNGTSRVPHAGSEPDAAGGGRTAGDVGAVAGPREEPR